jgi:type III secretion protein V
VQHFGPRQGVLVHQSHGPRLIEEKIVHWAPITSIMMETKRVMVENLELFLGIQPTSKLLDTLARSQPNLITDLRDTLTINQISLALKLLVQERIPLLSHTQVCEAILEWAPKRPDPQQILQQVRIVIGDRITRRFTADGFLPAIVIAPSLESLIREGFRTASEQSYLVIDSQISEKIVQQIRPLAPKSFKRGRDPVIVTQQDIRRSIRNLLHEHGIYIPVLAYQELSPETVVYPMEFVTAEGRKMQTDTFTPAKVDAA